jgi:hypothetical protein
MKVLVEAESVEVIECDFDEGEPCGTYLYYFEFAGYRTYNLKIVIIIFHLTNHV